MDSGNHFITEFYQWLLGLDEAYLVGISNKGIYNRSIKDLAEAGAPSIQILENSLTSVLSDGNTCTLVNDLKKYTCTCPSRSICKHVITSLIYLKENAGKIFGEIGSVTTEQSGDQNGFKALLEITPQEIRKQIGDKGYGDILFRLNYGVEVTVTEGVFLTVHFTEEEVRVRFPQKEPLRDAMCSCKSEAFCRHRAEAIMRYQLSKGSVGVEQFFEDKKSPIPTDTLAEIDHLLSEIMLPGLSRVPPTLCDTIDQMALICHNAGLANLEKLLRRLKLEMELFFNKDAGFDRSDLLTLLTRIWGIVHALQNSQGNGALVESLRGEHKSAYHEIPPIELIGIGAEAWASKSGFEGITFYFYSPRLKKWLTYSSSRPTYYEDADVNLSRMYKSAPPWGVEGSLDNFSKSVIRLVNAKLNDEGRISSSGETIGTIMGPTRFERDVFQELVVDRFEDMFLKIQKQLEFTIEDTEVQATLFIIKITNWGQSHFDPLTQLFTLPLYDLNQKVITLQIPYSKKNKPLIEKFETFEMIQDYPESILGKVFVSEGQLRVTPVMGYYANGTIMNLTLE